MKSIFPSTILFLLVISTPAVVSADSLLVGFNTQTPVQVYSIGGTYQQDFGPDGASAGIEESGLLYVVQPSMTATSSTVTALNAPQSIISSFSVSDLIADGAPGSNGTLWLAGYDGSVYQVSTNGQVLGTFNTGYSNIGIATNGSTLYTTEGDASDGIDVRDTSGNVVSTIHTGYTSLYGIAYDSSTGTLYAGSTDFIYEFDLSGGLLNSYSIAGDSRTPNGSVHDGLEVGDLSLLSSPAPPPPPTTVPEPRTGYLTGLLLAAGIFAARFRRTLKSSGVLLIPLLALPALGSVTVHLSLSPTTTVPVGTPVTFTTSASDSTSGSATFTYRFSVSSNSGPYAVVKDYYKTPTFTWAPSDHEGSYDIEVIAQSSTGATGSATEPLTVTSRVTGGGPVVNPTANALVALYSAPPCAAPNTVRVRFKAPNATAWQATPSKTCTGDSLNFYIAGMRQKTTYTLQQDMYRGPFDTIGPALSFTTAAIPAAVTIPAITVATGPVSPTSTSYPFILQMPNRYPFATDLSGNVVWYSAAYLPANNEGGYPVRTTNEGTLLGTLDDPTFIEPSTGQPAQDHQFLCEFDLAGNIIRETNATVLSKDLTAIRASEGKSAVHLNFINHEAYRLPNGDTAIQITDEEIANQGQGSVDVFGDAVLVLDSNFQIAWYWDTFDHLNITRKALLNDTCSAGQAGCPNILNKQPNGQYYTIANDWTHINAITFDPKDSNLVVSSRNQSWVWKISYLNGSGDGHIIWTLGMDGSFTLASGNPSTAWFSYQHDPKFQSNGALTVFDNGNYRVSLYGGNSRGQAWQLDETKMIATPIANFDLGGYSFAVGFASLLSNGNYDFGAGYLNGVGVGQTSEFTPSGTLVFRQTFTGSFSYRPMRLPDLYTLE